MANYSSDKFMEELMRISANFIWKNPELALAGESQVSSIEVEQYILAIRGTLTFDLIHKFEPSILVKFGYSEDEAERMQYSPGLIPQAIRSAVTDAHVEHLKKNYVEKNNYYRMLNGLPNLEDSDFIFNTKYPDISDSGTPIHLLDTNKLYQLDQLGFIEEIKRIYPEKKYLNHLTDKKVSIYNARVIPDFGLLWITESEYESLLNDFTNTYNQCRMMVTSVYYQQEINKTNSEYIGFMGMIILFATIMQMFRNCASTDINRDFYDNDSLKYVYESYGVPYYDMLPLEYHKRIVKNINILIRCKGSPEVFFKIFDIFGFGSTELFAYYILKTHRFENGKPIFPRDEDGNLDLRAMYDIKFAKVKLWDSPSLEVKDPQNWSSYSDMTGSDPYWISDKDLMNKIYEEEYNYKESKYFGIQTTFNLMKIMYESTYYLKMILDNRDLLPYTKIYNTTIQQEVSLFDMIIYLSAIVIRKYGYRGNIPSEPHAIGKFLGFDFQKDLTVLKENITQNDYLKNDKELLDLLTMVPVNSLSAIKTVYGKITQLREYITSKMFETDDPNIYHAYSELYDMIMFSEYTKDTFRKSDGMQATTFEELLEDINPTLYNRYLDQDLDEDMEITSALFFLENSCSLLNQIQFMSLPNSNFLLENIFKLLDYFKSTKTDLTGYHIIYSLVSDYDHYIKLMNIITFINDDYRSDPLESIIEQLTDVIAYIKDKMTLWDWIRHTDDLSVFDWITFVDMIDYLHDYLVHMTEILYNVTEEIIFSEDLQLREIFLLPGDNFSFEDCVNLIYDEVEEILKEFIDEPFPWDDKIICLAENFVPVESRNLFVSYLSCAEFIKFIFQYKYTLKDDIPLIHTHTHIQFEYTLRMLFKSYMERTHLNQEHLLEDIISYYIEKIQRREQQYTLVDDEKDKLIQDITLDVNDHKIWYLSELVSGITKTLLDSNYLVNDEIITRKESMPFNIVESQFIDQLIPTIQIPFVTSKHVLSDDIVMVYEIKKPEEETE